MAWFTSLEHTFSHLMHKKSHDYTDGATFCAYCIPTYRYEARIFLALARRTQHGHTSVPTHFPMLLSISGYNHVWIRLIADFHCSFSFTSRTTIRFFISARSHTMCLHLFGGWWRWWWHISCENRVQNNLIWFDCSSVCAHEDRSVHQFTKRLAHFSQFSAKVKIRNVVVSMCDRDNAATTRNKKKTNAKSEIIPAIQLDNYFQGARNLNVARWSIEHCHRRTAVAVAMDTNTAKYSIQLPRIFALLIDSQW